MFKVEINLSDLAQMYNEIQELQRELSKAVQQIEKPSEEVNEREIIVALRDEPNTRGVVLSDDNSLWLVRDFSTGEMFAWPKSECYIVKK